MRFLRECARPKYQICNHNLHSPLDTRNQIRYPLPSQSLYNLISHIYRISRQQPNYTPPNISANNPTLSRNPHHPSNVPTRTPTPNPTTPHTAPPTNPNHPLPSPPNNNNHHPSNSTPLNPLASPPPTPTPTPPTQPPIQQPTLPPPHPRKTTASVPHLRPTTGDHHLPLAPQEPPLQAMAVGKIAPMHHFSHYSKPWIRVIQGN